MRFSRFLAAVGIVLTLLAVPPQQARSTEKLTKRNKAIVRDFYTTVLIGRDVDAAPRFLRQDYIQHNPDVPTGLKGSWTSFARALRSQFPRTTSGSC